MPGKANVLSLFEERVGAIFGTSSEGYTAPFSFKKLAKKAAHEMENETYIINGVDTAPALYTVLVSSADDSAMRPLYADLTAETTQFIKAQAQKRGYSFIGEPLVRFMADPTLKSGKFSVFAENVDLQTLTRLRDEESAFYGGKPRRRGSNNAVPLTPARSTAQPTPSTGNPSAGLDILPSDLSEELLDVPDGLGEAASAASPVAAPKPTPLVQPHPRGTAAEAPSQTMLRPQTPAAAAETPVQHQQAVDTCLLIDRQSGRTYTAQAPRTILGRERTAHGIVLADPNISRRHAELSYDGTTWHITDLNSTNGTLVNNADIDECTLHNGDLITLGLVNLEFREA